VAVGERSVIMEEPKLTIPTMFSKQISITVSLHIEYSFLTLTIPPLLSQSRLSNCISDENFSLIETGGGVGSRAQAAAKMFYGGDDTSGV
jgi:hypothetical protein